MLVYDSLNDGRVVRVDSSFGNMETVFFTGGVVLAEQQGGDGSSSRKGVSTLPNGVQEQELMAWCHTEIQVPLPQHDTAGGRGRARSGCRGHAVTCLGMLGHAWACCGMPGGQRALRTDGLTRVGGWMVWVMLAGGPSDASRGDAVWPSAGHEVRRPAKPDRGRTECPPLSM